MNYNQTIVGPLVVNDLMKDYRFFLDIDLDMICLTKGEAGGILGTLGVPTYLV